MKNFKTTFFFITQDNIPKWVSNYKCTKCTPYRRLKNGHRCYILVKSTKSRAKSAVLKTHTKKKRKTRAKKTKKRLKTSICISVEEIDIKCCVDILVEMYVGMANFAIFIVQHLNTFTHHCIPFKKKKTKKAKTIRGLNFWASLRNLQSNPSQCRVSTYFYLKNNIKKNSTSSWKKTEFLYFFLILE